MKLASISTHATTVKVRANEGTFAIALCASSLNASILACKHMLAVHASSATGFSLLLLILNVAFYSNKYIDLSFCMRINNELADDRNSQNTWKSRVSGATSAGLHC